MKIQEDFLNKVIDFIVVILGRFFMYIEQGNMVYGDFKYVVSIFFYIFFVEDEVICSGECRVLLYV